MSLSPSTPLSLPFKWVSALFDFLTAESKPCLFFCGLSLGPRGVVRAELLLKREARRNVLLRCALELKMASRRIKITVQTTSFPSSHYILLLRGDQLRRNINRDPEPTQEASLWGRPGGEQDRRWCQLWGMWQALPTSLQRETGSQGDKGLPFLPCWCCKHQPKYWSQEALLPASSEVKFRYVTCSWSSRPHFLQKLIYCSRKMQFLI